MRQLPTPMTIGDLSADRTSQTIDLSSYYLASIQATVTGASAAGTASLYGSDDNTNFTKVSGSDATISGAGNGTWNIGQVGYRYIQVRFAFSSGTGTMVLELFGKGY